MTGLMIIIGNYIGGISTPGPVGPIFMVDQSGSDFIISEAGDNLIKE
jgi:hypothetical protein